MFGTPGRDDLLENCEIYQQNDCAHQITNQNNTVTCIALQKCVYQLNLVVTDRYEEVVLQFNISVLNEQPYNNLPLYYDPERNSPYLLMYMNRANKYTFSHNVFLDKESSNQLVLTAYLLDQETGLLDQLPYWLRVITDMRLVTGSPKPTELINCPPPQYSEVNLTAQNASGADVSVL